MKLLILVLACKDEKYDSFDKVCRETWVKDARKKRIRVIFYYGNSEPKLVDDNLFLRAEDSLEQLSEKFIEAINLPIEIRI